MLLSNKLPFSEKTKKDLINQLQKVNEKDLLEPLIKAALHPHPLPNDLQNLSNLQKSLSDFMNAPTVKPHLEAAISEAIKAKGLADFKKALKKSLESQHWTTSLLRYLAEELKLTPQEDTLVELGIKNGKIYWRLRNSQGFFYKRRLYNKADFDFEKEPTLCLSFSQFRAFKDSGKRSGTVEITEKRFVAHFEKPDEKIDAALIWNDLKNKNILNERNRLSASFRALSNETITLDKNIKLTPPEIINALSKITDDPNYKENIPGCPEYTYYRRERSKKSCAKTGRIRNEDPTSKDHCSRLWDVGTYSELYYHRNTAEEENKYTEKLNYDHIPSSSALANFPSDLKKEHEEKKAAYEAGLKKAERTCEPIRNTRSTATNNPPKAEAEPASINIMGELSAKIKNEKNKFDEKTTGQAWTIALPQKLHQSGATYCVSEKEQKEAGSEPLLNDLRAYAEILKKRAPDFNLSNEDYLKALGAFRYLYRSQVKNHSPVGGHSTLSPISALFFKEKTTLENIDKFMIDELRYFINEQEYKNAPSK